MTTNETVINTTVNVNPVKRRFPPHLLFTPTAWVKLERIMDVCSSNVLFHGFVKHPSDKSYVVYDLLPIPQYVENCTNYLDKKSYQAWRKEITENWRAKTVHQDGEEPPIYLLGELRTHGSIYDTDTETEALFHKFAEEAPADGFYTYVICDKQGRTRYVIHDKRYGMIYDSKDTPITVDITKMELFAETVLKNITTKKTKPEM